MSLKLKNICIRGDKDRGSDIIEFFERLGVKNPNGYKCDVLGRFYYVSERGELSCAFDKPDDRTLITLSPSSLLPSEWCVESTEVAHWLNDKYKLKGAFEYIGEYGWRYGEINGSPNCRPPDEPFGLELTPSQFTALTAPRKEEKEFVWTDELVKAYADQRIMLGNISLEYFKEINREEKIIIAGREVEFDGSGTVEILGWTTDNTDLLHLIKMLQFWKATLTISGEQVPIKTLTKILNTLNGKG
jgi:hypothetical protein